MEALRSKEGEADHLITVLREEIQMHREQVKHDLTQMTCVGVYAY